MPKQSTAILKEISLLKKYRELLRAIKTEPSKMELIEKANALCPKIQAIYESYRTELGLMDCSGLLAWPGLNHPITEATGLTPISLTSDLICKLEGLRHKQERLVKAGPGAGKATETPGSGKEKTLVSLEDVVQGGVKPEQFKKMRKMLEDVVEKQTRERSMELGEMFREQDRDLRERLKGITGKRGPLEQATETPPQQGQGEGKDIKKFFRNHWQWLIGAIIGFIGMILGILQFLVMKK